MGPTLLDRTCRRADLLWNSFVRVGWTSAFLELVAGANPALYGAFAPLATLVGTRQEPRTVERVYHRLPRSTGFSETILAKSPERLGVIPAWIDRVRLAEAS